MIMHWMLSLGKVDLSINAKWSEGNTYGFRELNFLKVFTLL